MSTVASLRDALMHTGKVDAAGLARAEQDAAANGRSLANALLALNLVDAPHLRRLQAELMGIPYWDHVSCNIDSAVRDMVSLRCARRWRLCPVRFSEGDRRLTLAIGDPDQAPYVQALFRFMLQPHDLAFVIAPEEEIIAAVNAAPEEDPAMQADDEIRPDKPRSLNLGARRKDPESVRSVPVRSGRKQASAGSREEGASEEMNRALISAVALAARLHVQDDVEAVAAIHERIRYCQLIGARLKLSAFKSNALVAAAWMSAMWPHRDLVRAVQSPYDLEAIVFPGESNSRPRVEAAVLSLVKSYQELEKIHPEMSRDVNLVRRELRVRWSDKAGHEHILETFLQVLMDEEFLSTLDETARRILIVDADEDRFANMGPSLTQSGYQVVTVGDPAAAESVFKDFEPNVVIVSMDFPRDAGLSLCKRIRRLEKSGGALVMALVSANDNRMAAECLRVGADDFLTKPADLELLFLKLRSRLGEESHEASGVTGLLSEMNFNDMVQIFSAGRRSIMIHLTAEAAEGRVWMREGQVVHAEAEDKTGEEAFYALMRWKSGEFKTQMISNFPEQSISVSTMSLLMEGSRQADEGDG